MTDPVENFIKERQQLYLDSFNYSTIKNPEILQSEHKIPLNRTEMLKFYKIHNLKKDIHFGDNYYAVYCRISRTRQDDVDFPEPITFTANYATIYCTKDTPQFFTCGGTFISSDGEYHPFLCNYPASIKNMRNYRNYGSEVLKYLSEDLEESDFEINCFPKNNKLENSIREDGVGLLFYISAWTLYHYLLSKRLISLHENEKYALSINKSKDDQKYFLSMQEKYPDDVRGFITMTYYFIDNNSYTDLPIMGVKSVPMTMRDREYKGDIGQSIWKEIRMNYLTSELVMNQISPSFSNPFALFIIKDANSNMFDNNAMQKKIERSVFADTLLKDLESTRKKILEEDPTPTDNFGALSNLIEYSEEFIREELYIVPRTICVVSEYMGNTWNDLQQFYDTPTSINKYGDMRLYNVGVRYIWEFIYALYCMHTKLRLIHGDLHLNNITLSPRESGIGSQKSYTTYIVKDRAYVFNNSGAFSSIIDFSRCLLFENVITENLTADVDDYITKQRRSIFRIYRSEFKEFYQLNLAKLQASLAQNTKLFYKMFSAIDIYRLFSGLEHIFTKIEAETRVINLINEIKKISLYYLTNLSLRLSEDQDFEFPAALCIKNLFGDHLAEKVPKEFWEATPTEIYNSNNELRYNLVNQEEYPPLIAMGLPEKKNKDSTPVEISNKARIRRQPFISL